MADPYLFQDTVRILHLSDVHFGSDKMLKESNRITDAVVAACSKSSAEPDLCIFSGDLAYSGQAAEFEMGTKWLSDLSRIWPQMKLFVVPGNHDIDRSSANLILRKANIESQYFRCREELAKCLTHLSAFGEWHKQLALAFGSKLLSDWSNPFGCSRRMTVRDRELQLIGLNTALLSCGDDDKGKIVQDVAILNEMLAEKRDDSVCVLAVGHHPLDWLAQWNEAAIAQILQQTTGAHVYMHGHRHEQGAGTAANGRGSRLTTLECGAAYQTKRPKFFSFYALNFGRREIDISVYTFSPSAGDWNLDGGRSYTIVAPLPFRVLSVDPAADDANPPQQQAPEGSRELDELRARRAIDTASQIFDLADKIIRNPVFVNCPIYNSSSRLKKLEEVLSKLERKRAKTPEYDVSNIEDICGFRITVLFQKDILIVIEKFLALARDRTLGLAFADFKIIVHTSRPINDPLSIVGAVRSIHSHFDIKTDLEINSSPTGYSSVHVTAQCSVGPPAPKKASIELQIRSVLEEFWGQLDHKLRYAMSRGRANDAGWHSHLNVLKTMFDGLVQYVDIIRDLYVPISALPAASEPVLAPLSRSALSFSTPDDQLQNLREAGLPQPILTQVEKAFQLWKVADASRQFGGSALDFRTAADAFSPFIEGGEPGSMPTDASGLLSYVARMERAYMLIGTSEAACLDEARRIYDDVLSVAPNDLQARFRSGQVLLGKGQFQDAVIALAATVAEGKKPGRSADPGTQMLLTNAQLSLALAHYRVFEEAELPGNERAKSLSRAIKLVKEIYERVEDPDTNFQSLNDLLYYIWEEREQFGSGATSVTQEELDHLVHVFREAIQRTKTVTFRQYDTLARVMNSVRDDEAAVEAARKVCRLLQQAARERSGDETAFAGENFNDRWLSRVQAHMQNLDERDSLNYAWKTLLRLSHGP